MRSFPMAVCANEVTLGYLAKYSLSRDGAQRHHRNLVNLGCSVTVIKIHDIRWVAFSAVLAGFIFQTINHFSALFT